MSFSTSRRRVAALVVASSGVALALSTALLSSPSASAAVAPAAAVPEASTAAVAAAAPEADSSWFVDPRTPAQRRDEVAVPRNPKAYRGKVVETRAVYRTRDGSLAVPMRFAFGHTVATGQAVTLDGNGLFVVNTSVLTTAARSQVRRLATALEDASRIRCEGYADYAGAADRNNVLARDRAARVCDLLVAVSPGLVATTVGYGPDRPAVIGGDSEARRLNRRVVVEMTGTRPAPPVTPQAQVPGPPVLEYVNGSSGSVYYAYSAPVDDGGSPVTGYEVTTGDGWDAVQPLLGRPSGHRCIADCGSYLYGYLGDLAPGSTVDLRVRAVNAVGAGAPSNNLSAPVYGVPSAPTGLAVEGGDTTLGISFGEPENDGGSAVTAYQYSIDGGDTWAEPNLAGDAPWTVVVEELENGTVYDVRVRAVNQWGHGPSATAEGLPAGVPGAPTLGEPSVDGATAVLTFTAPDSTGGAAITGYEITIDGGDTWGPATVSEVDPGVYEATLSDLVYGQQYGVQVRAVNLRGHGPASALRTVAPVTLPGAPTGLAATVDGTSLQLSFGAPEFDGGSEVTGYEISIDEGEWGPATTTGTGPLVITLTGQGTGTHVYVVRAVNAVGAGPGAASDPVEVVVVPAPLFDHGWTWSGTYWAYWNIGDVDPDAVTGWELSVDGGDWLPLSVTGSSVGYFSGTTQDVGCVTTGGSCPYSTTGRVRAVTTTGYSAPSNVAPIWLD